MRAFTLLEVMIVIALIGLIAALTGPRVIDIFIHGQEDIAAAKCQQYYEATCEWMMFTRAARPPQTLAELEDPIRPGGRPFMRHEPDPWGSHYRIEHQGGRRYRIWSNGPDGEEGTADDIAYEPVED